MSLTRHVTTCKPLLLIPLDQGHTLALLDIGGMALPRLLDGEGYLVRPLPGVLGEFASQVARVMPSVVYEWLPAVREWLDHEPAWLDLAETTPNRNRFGLLIARRVMGELAYAPTHRIAPKEVA
jgi:hypothetical protein